VGQPLSLVTSDSAGKGEQMTSADRLLEGRKDLAEKNPYRSLHMLCEVTELRVPSAIVLNFRYLKMPCS